MLIVKKFGGTSVANPERIKHIIKIIKTFLSKGHKIVLVVSAKASMTDSIISDIESFEDISNFSDDIMREFNQAVITGESMNASIISCALNKNSIKSISLNAYNLPIIGKNNNIIEINKNKIISYLNSGYIPVITGFQALDSENQLYNINLGRGGSDYSAVMISAAINADECYIYSDVDGIFDSDPNIVKNALKIQNISYDDAILMTSSGAKILQDKSVIAAKKYNISIKVLSSFMENYDDIDFNQIGTNVCTKYLINRSDNEFYSTVSYNKNTFEISIIFIGSNIKLNNFFNNHYLVFFNNLNNFLQNSNNISNFELINNQNQYIIIKLSNNHPSIKIIMNEIYNFCREFNNLI